MRQIVLDSTPFGTLPVSIRFDQGARTSLAFDTEDIELHLDFLLQQYPKLRNDAVGSAAFARGLEYIFKEVLKVEYPAFRAAEFIPLSTEVPAGSLTATYRMYQNHGTAKVISNFSAELPNADIDGREWESPIATIGSSYSFSVIDAQRAAILDIPLEQMKADAARFAIGLLSEQIACKGLPSMGITGLSNAAGIQATTQVSTGTWKAQIAAIGAATAAAPAAAVAAVQGIAADVAAMASAIDTNTNGIHQATNVLLPSSLYSILKNAPRSPAFTNDTLLDYLESLLELQVDRWVQLNNADAEGHGRVMVYEKSPQVLRLIEAQPFTQLPPQPKNLAWQVPCLAQLGGVNVMRPAAVTYMDGLDVALT